MHMPRSAASGTASDITGYLGFSSGGESSCFFMTDMYPIYFFISSYCVIDFIQTVSSDSVNSLYSGIDQHVNDLFCYFLCHKYLYKFI